MNIDLGINNEPSAEEFDMKEYLLDVLEGDDVLDLDSRQYDEMSRLFNMIDSASDENIAIQFLSNDQTFVDCFGTEQPKEQIIARMESSNEHLLQDFLRWGVAGMIAGAILARFSRIRSICAKAKLTVDQEKFDNWTARSLYLPPASQMKILMDGLEQLAKGIESTINDPKFDLGTLSEALRKCGIDVNPGKGDVSKIITTDWKAVGGDWIGKILGTAIVGISWPASTVGAHMTSSNGGTLADKGYTKASLVEYADRIVKLIDMVYKLKDMKNQKGVHEEAENLSAKLRFVKKAIDVLVHTIKNVGRGMAAAIGHVS
ncbi:MAG: hypothetical protein IKA36_06895 [Clostridia bacterium]|nr:hypothetical protein [Clostridia bacterium]